MVRVKSEEYDLEYITNRDNFPNEDKSFYLFILLNSLSCNTCIEEAIFVEELKRSYGDRIQIIAIVGNFGNTAINNFKNRYKLSYEFIEKDKKTVFYKFSNIKTLKIITNKDGLVLNIDPVTYNLKSLRKKYEDLLRKTLL